MILSAIYLSMQIKLLKLICILSEEQIQSIKHSVFNVSLGPYNIQCDCNIILIATLHYGRWEKSKTDIDKANTAPQAFDAYNKRGKQLEPKRYTQRRAISKNNEPGWIVAQSKKSIYIICTFPTVKWTKLENCKTLGGNCWSAIFCLNKNVTIDIRHTQIVTHTEDGVASLAATGGATHAAAAPRGRQADSNERPHLIVLRE